MGNLSELYEKNLSVMLHGLLTHDKLARFELAELANVTRTTVSNSITELISRQIVYETEEGAASAQGGRKPIYLEINKNAFGMIGLDLRREKISGCLVNLTGEILRSVSIGMPIYCAQEMVWETFGRVIAHLTEGQNIPVLGIGVGSIGPLNPVRGMLSSPTEFESMRGANIRDVLQATYDLPVILQVGASAASVGEHFWAHHSTSRLRSLAFVVIDYGGIGLSLIADDVLWNTDGLAGELGHVTIDYRGPVCECGRNGCLALYASGRALIESVVRLRGHDSASITLADIAQLAKNNDTEIQQCIANAGAYLANGIIDIDRMLRPERIVIGSSHEHLDKWYLQGIRRFLADSHRGSHELDLPQRLVTASKGSWAIAYGAATMQIKAFYDAPLAILGHLQEASPPVER